MMQAATAFLQATLVILGIFPVPWRIGIVSVAGGRFLAWVAISEDFAW